MLAHAFAPFFSGRTHAVRIALECHGLDAMVQTLPRTQERRQPRMESILVRERSGITLLDENYFQSRVSPTTR